MEEFAAHLLCAREVLMTFLSSSKYAQSNVGSHLRPISTF